MNLEELQNEVQKLKEYNEELKKFMFVLKNNTHLRIVTNTEESVVRRDCFGSRIDIDIVSRPFDYTNLLKK